MIAKETQKFFNDCEIKLSEDSNDKDKKVFTAKFFSGKTIIGVYDWDFGKVNITIDENGIEWPEDGVVPLLNSHDSGDSQGVIGRVEKISNSEGRVFFDEKDDVALKIMGKVEGGFIRRFSAGFNVISKEKVDGNTVVYKKIELLEGSVVPIGKDRGALIKEGFQEKGNGGNKMEEKKNFAEEAEKAKKAAEKAVHDRYAVVMKLCEQHGITNPESISRAALSENPAEVVLSEITRKTGADKAVFMAAMVDVDEADKFRQEAIFGQAHKFGLKIDREKVQGNQFQRATNMQLCEHIARRHGRNPFAMHEADLIQFALTTGDFVFIAQNIANMALGQQQVEQMTTWQRWCQVGNARNFKPQTVVNTGRLGRLQKLTSDSIAKSTNFSDYAELVTVDEYGISIDIGRKLIVNDELGAVMEVIGGFAGVSDRSINEDVYLFLASNPVMNEDSTALFDATTHKNIATGGFIGLPGIENLDEAEKSMRMQKDHNSRAYIGMPPKYLLCPVSIQSSTNRFFSTEKWDDTDTGATRGNNWQGRLEVITDPYLDGDPAAPVKHWYLAGPVGTTIVVNFLGGNPSPEVTTTINPDTRGVRTRVFNDYGIGVKDWRMLYKNPAV